MENCKKNAVVKKHPWHTLRDIILYVFLFLDFFLKLKLMNRIRFWMILGCINDKSPQDIQILSSRKKRERERETKNTMNTIGMFRIQSLEIMSREMVFREALFLYHQGRTPESIVESIQAFVEHVVETDQKQSSHENPQYAMGDPLLHKAVLRYYKLAISVKRKGSSAEVFFLDRLKSDILENISEVASSPTVPMTGFGEDLGSWTSAFIREWNRASETSEHEWNNYPEETATTTRLLSFFFRFCFFFSPFVTDPINSAGLPAPIRSGPIKMEWQTPQSTRELYEKIIRLCSSGSIWHENSKFCHTPSPLPRFEKDGFFSEKTLKDGKKGA